MHCWGVEIYFKDQKRYKSVDFFADLKVAREYASYYKTCKTRIRKYKRVEYNTLRGN